MNEDEMFDFYKAFLGVDIAKAEQIGEIVGMVVASVYKGMIGAGLDDVTARNILSDAERILLASVLGVKPPEAS